MANQYDDADTSFTAHGTYSDGYYGYEVMLSDDNDGAKVRDLSNGEISDWLEIEYVEDEDSEVDEDGYPESNPVIDPNGYNIPLNQVMRVNKSFNKKNNMKKELDTVANSFEKTSAVQDSTDVWKAVRDYILSRTGDRFNTIEEMTDDVNERYKSVMSQIQQSYDNWFEGELKSNYHVFDIEILGDDSDIVVEDDMSNEAVDENGMGQEDEMNDDINLEDENF